MSLAPVTRLAAFFHLVELHEPGGPMVPDGDGGWTQGLQPLDPPTWRCRVAPASVRELERITAGTPVTHATHIASGPYHPGISTNTQLHFDGRVLYVNGVATPEERRIDTIAFCEERVTTNPPAA